MYGSTDGLKAFTTTFYAKNKEFFIEKVIKAIKDGYSIRSPLIPDRTTIPDIPINTKLKARVGGGYSSTTFTIYAKVISKTKAGNLQLKEYEMKKLSFVSDPGGSTVTEQVTEKFTGCTFIAKPVAHENTWNFATKIDHNDTAYWEEWIGDFGEISTVDSIVK